MRKGNSNEPSPPDHGCRRRRDDRQRLARGRRHRVDQAARNMCGITDEATKLQGKQRYCYETNSKSMKARVAAILDKHNEASGG